MKQTSDRLLMLAMRKNWSGYRHGGNWVNRESLGWLAKIGRNLLDKETVTNPRYCGTSRAGLLGPRGAADVNRKL